MMRVVTAQVPIYTPPPPAPPQVTRAIETSATAVATLGGPRRAFVPPRAVPTGPIPNTVIDAAPIEFAGIATVAVNEAVGLLPSTGAAVLPGRPPEPVKTTPAPPADPPKLVRLSEGVLKGKLLTMVRPAYPTIAKQARVSGTVRLLGIIGRDGRVRELRVLDGPAMLRQAAYDAVIQWVYSPTMLSGSPVEVEAPIEVNFRLN